MQQLWLFGAQNHRCRGTPVIAERERLCYD